MLARFINYLWPTNSGRNPGNPIIKLANQMVGEDSYTRIANYFTRTDSQSQDPTQQLFRAVRQGDLAAVKEFIETKKLPVDSALTYGPGWPRRIKTPLLEAICEMHWDIARYLIDQGADVNFQERDSYYTEHCCSPLMMIAYKLKDQKEEVQSLFKYMVEEKGGDINQPNSAGYTLIHNAIRQDDQMLFDYCLQHNATIEVTPHKLGGSANTALYGAAMYNRLSMAEELLKRGANVDGEARPGHSSPLSNAAYQDQSRIEMMKLLLRYGASVNLPGHNGDTPLRNAVQSGRIDHARLLLENGADCNQRNDYGDSAESRLNDIATYNACNLTQPVRTHNNEEYPLAEMQALFNEFKEKRLAAESTSYEYSSSDDEDRERRHASVMQ